MMSIAELAASPGMGAGAYQFARPFAGPRGALFVGLCECLKCVVVNGVIVVAIGEYAAEVTGAPQFLAPVWWAAGYLKAVWRFFCSSPFGLTPGFLRI